MSTEALTFESWKSRLQEDCQRRDKLLAYSILGEDCLRILWESGTEPSVDGIIDDGKKAA